MVKFPPHPLDETDERPPARRLNLARYTPAELFADMVGERDLLAEEDEATAAAKAEGDVMMTKHERAVIVDDLLDVVVDHDLAYVDAIEAVAQLVKKLNKRIKYVADDLDTERKAVLAFGNE